MAKKTPSQDARERMGKYLSLSHSRVKLKKFLGGGTDGEVWESNRKTAIKLLARERGYYNERDTYLRLEEFGITEQICGFWVPHIVEYHDELRIVEMDMMQTPPYIIDFAKVRLDRPPEFPVDVVREHHELGVERFQHNWPKVQMLLKDLESYQIYYLDPNRGNITFPDMP